LTLTLTETIEIADPRYSSPKAKCTREHEIKGLRDRETWQVVARSDVPENANLLGGRFVMTIEEANTDKEVVKARYVVQGHRDRGKAFLVHNSTNMRQASTKIILCIAAIFGFRVWTHDVTQAYTKYSENLMRDVFIDPKKNSDEFKLNCDQVLKLLRLLYSLTDAGDYWNATMSRHMRDDLGMIPTAGDISLFTKHVGSELCGIAGTYVDDSLLSGNADFLKLSETSQQKFDSRERQFDIFAFAGVDINTEDDCCDLSF
jgi:Reverse transcriptase (RNA-dependent DNA polymerase)